MDDETEAPLTSDAEINGESDLRFLRMEALRQAALDQGADKRPEALLERARAYAAFLTDG